MTKKWMKILILLLSIVFISTAVYARSNKNDSKKNSYSWWRMPYYQLIKAVKTTKKLQKDLYKINRKSNQLERKAERLRNKIDELSKQLNEVQEQMGIVASMEVEDNNDGIDREKEKIICPGCRFQETDQFENGDFSGGFLQFAYFDAAYLNGADFTGAKLRKASFWGAQLKGANMQKADIRYVYLAGTNLCGAMLPKDLSLREGITWSVPAPGFDTICPDNSFAEINGGTCEGHLDPIDDITACKELPEL